MRPPVYLDYAATTPVRPEVLEAMLPYLTAQSFGNPSSAHRFGRAARAGIEQARRQVAEAVGAEPNQVVFTSGGTEADNLGIVGAALAARERGGSMCAVVSAIEHKAVLAAAHAVCHLGGREVLLPVDSGGRLDLDALDAALAEDPAVVSVMWVNNETGVSSRWARSPPDAATRASSFTPMRCRRSARCRSRLPSCHAPCSRSRGTRSGRPRGSVLSSCATARRSRPSSMAAGSSSASGRAPRTWPARWAWGGRRSWPPASRARWPSVCARCATSWPPDSRPRWRIWWSTPKTSARAPHLLSVAVHGADSEALLMHLDLAGIAASSGSACSTGAVEPSHVLVAMGVPRELALGAIRFSFGRESTGEDVDRAVEVVPAVVAKVPAELWTADADGWGRTA